MEKRKDMFETETVTVNQTGLPHSREAEEAVIGSVLINPECFKDVAGILNPGGEDFYIHRLRFIWEAYEALDSEGSPVDSLTVSEKLDQAGHLEEIGGPAYLVSLLNQVPTSLHAEAYSRIVAEKVKVTDNGLEITMPQKKILRQETPQVPEQRSF